MKNAILFFLNYLWGPRDKFLVYHFRWQCGLLLTPLLFLFIDFWHLNYWIAMILFNVCGAFIYFPVDKYIFKAREKKTGLSTQDTEERK